MKFNEFVGQVQHRAQLASTAEAVRAIRATLQTLGERLDAGEAKDLGAQLPRELAFYLKTAEHSKRMTLDDFLYKVSEREQVDVPDGTYHARVVIEVLQEAVSEGEIKDVLAELPSEWAPLFTSGSQGQVPVAEAAER